MKGQLGTKDAIFEGSLLPSSTATWSGAEDYGEDVGIPLQRSSILASHRAYTQDQGNYSAAIAVELVDNGAGFAVGDFVNTLAQGPLETPLQVFVMASSGSVDMLSNGPYYEYGGLDADEAVVSLDRLYTNISVGDIVIVEADGKVMASRVDGIEIGTGSFEDASYPISKLTITPASIIGPPSEPSAVRVWFDARKAGTIERVPSLTVTGADMLNTSRAVTLGAGSSLPTADTDIIMQDAEGTAIAAKGGGSTISGVPQITITKIVDVQQAEVDLVKPITFIWGLNKVTRGESVNREVIGSGNAVLAWQSLALAKSPLTYVADPFAPGGRKPELEVFVNGLKWTRALSFYNATPTDEIYVIRHDIDHQTYIQFGNGELGKRLPTGTNNVVANYRFGTGGNVEANTISKLIRPIAGVTSIANPLAASGGEDPPTEAQTREKAIESLRVLGRLVSLADFEVEAARYGGVLQAKARWAWDEAGEDALVKLWIVCEGPGDPSPDLRTYLQNMAEPGARVEVVKAIPWYQYLNLDLEFDPNYLPQEVEAAVHARLYDEFDGLAAPRNAPIGGVLHRSELYAAIHEVAGLRSVRGASVNFSPMGKTISTPEGYYLALRDSPIF